MGEFRMKKNDRSMFENKWVIRVVSLLVSVLLFGYVYSENYGLSTINRNDSISTTRSETISNLPIQINMDTNRYFISGLPETVVLSLTGPESVIVQTLSANDFDIVTEDLNQLGPGRHTIQIKAENLSDELTYQITPSRVNVTIEEKVSVESAVEVLFNSSNVDEEYIAGTPILSHDTVIITGPESTVERIDRIYVRVTPSETPLTSDVSMNTVVQVEDANGNKLNVTVDPQEISVEIPVLPYEKVVPLKVVQKGTPVAGKKYDLSIIGETEVTLTGNRNALADVDEMVIEADISGIKSNTVLDIPIPLPVPSASVNPEAIQVNVEVSNTTTESTADKESTREKDDTTNKD